MSSVQEKKTKQLKIVLKKKTAVDVDPNYAENTSKILEHSIHEIYNHKAKNHDYEKLYSKVKDMVMQKFGERLYSGLVSTMTFQIQATSKSIEAAARDGSFLEELSSKWTDHNRALELIRGVFAYADGAYVRRTHKTSIRDLCLNLWRENVIPSTLGRLELVDAILERILREREGGPVDRAVMRNVVSMLREVMGRLFYEECFEGPFLDASEEFYRAESERLAGSCDCWEYLREAERRLDEERDRVSHYLDEKSGPKIARVVEKEMIENHVDRLARGLDPSALVKMLSDDEFEDIGRMFRLFGRVPNGLSAIRDVMISDVRDFGRPVVSDPERSENDPVRFVETLIKEREKYDRIISEAFNSDEVFSKALNTSFGYIVNLNPHCPEYVSLFVDEKLRNGLKVARGEEEIEATLDKAAVLIRYVHEKDVFEKYYKQHLAKRLLSGNTLSEDAEKRFIAKLKTVCGHQFTSKSEAMLADIEASRDTMRGFLEHGPPAVVVRVLKTGSWPTKSGPPCNLPSELSPLCEKFESYYVGTHTGRRKLSWQANMGSAEITASFSDGRSYELSVSTYQMCVLMLFNDSDLLTYEEIERATEIPRSDLKRCLHSLACVEGKNVLLRKEPVSTTDKIGEGDVFSVNDRFTSELSKVKIGTVSASQVESEPEEREKRQRVDEHRKPQIEAAIVRIMKSRRALDHKSLIAEVTKELQPLFLPNPLQVKKRIESLIERDFLERDDVDRSRFRYVA